MKFQHLRDERQRLVKKIKQSIKSGAGTADIFRPSLWWFDLVKFLDKENDSTPTTDNLNVSIGQVN